eukprot:GHVN01045819.1.p1 GENE.GHVN01045819.1~~GHVN01045819.1.p1  ORF type:complete len:196 (+),score=23.26 GHVN01045819.1:112-699(+)
MILTSPSCGCKRSRFSDSAEDVSSHQFFPTTSLSSFQPQPKRFHSDGPDPSHSRTLISSTPDELSNPNRLSETESRRVYSTAVSKDAFASIANTSSSDINRPTTMWIGDLEPWEDENYLSQLFRQLTTQMSSAKVVRDKVSWHLFLPGTASFHTMFFSQITHFPLGFGFIEFSSHAAAQQVMDMLPQMFRPGNGR